MGGRTAARARRDIEALARAGHDTATFAERAQAVLAGLVPHAAACVVTVDPATLLLTGSYKFGALAGQHDRDRAWADLEYGTEEPTAIATLARCEHPAAAVSAQPGGLAASPRGQELLGPAGFGDELRVVARHEGHCWGAVNLFRGDDEPTFSDEEVAVLASLSDALSAGLRAGLLARLAGRGHEPHGEATSAPPVARSERGPAVLVVGADGHQHRVSAGAGDLLEELTSEANRSPAASVVEALVQGARRYSAGALDQPPRVRVRRPDGRWLVAHAAPLVAEDRPTGEVVVTVEEARPPEVVPLLVAAFGLSARERDVTHLVLQGHDTRAIAEALHMSSYTVQDHLKAVFDKADVRSRRELVARVFFDQYAPRLGGELAPSGGLLSAGEAALTRPRA